MMKTAFRSLLLLSAVITASAVLQASSTAVAVGSYNDGNSYPFLANDSGATSGQTIDYQQVYSSSAFSGPVAIQSISFYFAQAFGGSSTVLDGNYSVYLSTTAAAVNGFGSDLVANRGADWSLFAAFSGGADSTPNWTIRGAAFSYDPGHGNLLLEVIANNQGFLPNGAGNGFLESDDFGTVTSRAYVLGTGTSAAVTDSIGLVTAFNAPEPGSLVLFGSGLAGLAEVVRRKHRV